MDIDWWKRFANHRRSSESVVLAGSSERPTTSRKLLPAHSRLPTACLEFAGFLARPAFDDDLGFRVKLYGVLPLGMENAEEAFLPPVEREIGHRRSYTDVDPDISGRRFVAEFARRGAAGGEQRSLVAIGALAHEIDCLIDVVRVHQAQHRAENLGIGQRTGRRHAIQNRRL